MKREQKLREADQTFQRMVLERGLAPHGPDPTQTAAAYRIAGYTDGLVGATPECGVLKPKFDSGLKFDMPGPGRPRWGPGVGGGVPWDGTFHRDTARYLAGGPLFWSAYLKPGTAPGEKNGYWLNFGSGWCHLHNDDPAQMLSGAAPRIYYDAATTQWHLIIEATKFVTCETVLVWSGAKVGGNDPCGVYARVDGLDTTGTLTIEAAP
jgi:hypothetical protein